VDLTAAERVLLHLHDFWTAREPVRETTQEGISAGAAVLRSHVPRAMRSLMAHGEVEESSGRIRGRGRKVKVYRLTEAGIRRARSLLDGVLDMPVNTDAGPSPVRDVARAHGLRPAEVIASLGPGGSFRPPPASTEGPEALLGREADLAALREWYAGPGPALVLYGARGIGKTALVRAFAQRLTVPVHWIDLEASPRLPPESPGELLRERRLLVADGYGEAPETAVEFLSGLVAAAARRPPGRLLVACQNSTPSYCRFYSRGEVEAGVVREVHLKGLSPGATRQLLQRPDLDGEALRRVYLLTKGCPTCLTMIREGDAEGLRRHTRFTRAEVGLLLFSARAPGRERAALSAV